MAQVGSPGGLRGSPGVDFERIFDDFWSYVGVFLVTFSEGFRVYRSIVSHGLLMFLVLMSVRRGLVFCFGLFGFIWSGRV